MLNIKKSIENGEAVFALEGRLDTITAPELERELRGSLEDVKLLTLDFGGVSFMDSSGIAVVMRCRQRMRELGGTVTLRRVAPQPRRVFDASGVTKLIAIE